MVLARVDVSGAISLREKEASEEKIWSERREHRKNVQATQKLRVM